MLKLGHSLKFTQKLSPQQIQLMKLLQYPTTSFEGRIEEELEANFALEKSDDTADLDEENYDASFDKNINDSSDESGESSSDSESGDEFGDNDAEGLDAGDMEYDDLAAISDHSIGEMDDYVRDYMEDDPSVYQYNSDSAANDEDGRSTPVVMENSFHEHLETQLGLISFADERSKIIAQQIIGSIDDDGYLRRDLDAMVDDLIFSQNIVTTEKEIVELLGVVQRFDPPGVGARNLQECLLIQLRQKLEMPDDVIGYEDKLVIKLAIQVIQNFFDEYTKKHFSRLVKQLDLHDEEELRDADEQIRKLNPKPASGFVTRNEQAFNYIVPDFFINNNNGELELSLNSRNTPELRVNDYYRDMLKSLSKRKSGKDSEKKDKDAFLFIKNKIDSAKWFIDAIKQRQQTLLHTMNAIMIYQYEFFVSGDQKRIKPMILKDIADLTGLDISTISRVANSKYVQTEFGTRRLKDFFSESLSTEDGEEVSTIEVKDILSEIVSAENKRRPLSDEKLRTMLHKRGYNIARRTVAKYREQLNINVARLRRELG